jgi:ATP synthase protein I
MTRRDDQHDEALKRLDDGLDAFEAKRVRDDRSQLAVAGGAGYRLIAELIGGLLGGLGLGWLVDRLAHTTPWGIAVGVSLGAGLSVYLAARTAARMGAQALAKSGPVPPVPADADDDD